MKESKRVYGIILTDHAIEELGDRIKPYLLNPSKTIIYCKSISPDGNYFHAVVDRRNNGETIEMEILLPHRYIKMVAATTDEKNLGFS